MGLTDDLRASPTEIPGAVRSGFTARGIVTSVFREAVWALVRTVPPGRVTTYGEIAEAYHGVRRGSRGVGRALAGCPEDVPWWRVVRAGGLLPPMTFAAEQQARLAEEGVPFTPDGRVALAAAGGVFSPPATGRRRRRSDPTSDKLSSNPKNNPKHDPTSNPGTGIE